PAEIENIMRILVEQCEIIFHGLANVFVDDLGILPSPFRIEVGIADHVKSWLFGQIGFPGGLCMGCGEHPHAGQGNRYQSRGESPHRNSPKAPVGGVPFAVSGIVTCLWTVTLSAGARVWTEP